MWFSRTNKIKNSAHTALVLMYHKIGEPATDVWDIAVSEQNLEEHLLYLKDENIVSLDELTHSLKKKKLKKNCIAITFDDGYIDNFSLAKPLLEKYKLPATFFIPTINIVQQKEFWWDELEYLFLGIEELPASLSIYINGIEVAFDIGIEAKLSFENKLKHKAWKPYEENPPTIRCAAFLKIWELLKPLRDDEQQNYLNVVRKWIGVSAAKREEFQCMSAVDLQQLAAHKLFQIGAHTTSHIALAFHDKDFQKKEIIDNKLFLESLIHKKVDLLAYPYGNYNDETLTAARKAGMRAAFTTEEGILSDTANLYRINRFQVKNQNGIEFKNNLDKWLNH